MPLDPKNRTLIDLLGDTSTDKYYVPNFQRDFAWGNDQVEELWSDLINAEDDNEDSVFLGHLILYRRNKNSDDDDSETGLGIIDGQQRITTLSLLIIACRDYAKELGFYEHSADLQNLLSFKDRATLEVSGFRVKVANNIRHLFEYMVGDQQWQSSGFPLKIRNQSQKKPIKKIQPVYDFFMENLRSLKSKEDFVKLKKSLYRCYFIVLEIDVKTKAFEIFERTNARGVPLNIGDLLKNLLFSKDDLHSLEPKWDDIVQRSGTTLPRMVKYFTVLFHGLARKKDIYRKLKGTVLSMETEIFIDQLSSFSQFYQYSIDGGDVDLLDLVLDDTKNKLLRGNLAHYRSVQRVIESLTFFGVTQPIPVIYSGLVALGNISGTDGNTALNKKYIELITTIEKYHFVNNVICTTVGHETEVLYATYAQKIYSSETSADFKKHCTELEAELRKKKEKEANFVAKFTDIYYEPKPSVLGLLAYIFDRFQNIGEEGGQIKNIFNTDSKVIVRDYSVDHFWEQSAAPHFEGPKELLHNIGNLNIIPRHTNSDDVKGLAPLEKISILRERNFEGLKYVKDFATFFESKGSKWTQSEVNERAKELAIKAYSEIWNF
ncbi:MAG: DUF262 domain-containing protein [Candidatus Pacebacteria bacterium]|jgi:hypothetical protein|nr:DUF262 domain-containing protein [Candidatus Paceibacterota bacterium]